MLFVVNKKPRHVSGKESVTCHQMLSDTNLCFSTSYHLVERFEFDTMKLRDSRTELHHFFCVASTDCVIVCSIEFAACLEMFFASPDKTCDAFFETDDGCFQLSACCIGHALCSCIIVVLLITLVLSDSLSIKNPTPVSNTWVG